MANGDTTAWSDPDKKTEAVYKVLRYLAANPKEGMSRVGDDAAAAQLFKDIGGIEVPAGQRVIFFASGEQALRHAGSVSLEVPPEVSKASDLELKAYILGNYPYWPPG